MSKIGIYSGIFDPIHKGHVTFALAAAKAANLDKVYFLVEPKPRRKHDVTHLAHRIAMVRIAIDDQTKLELLDIPDKQFSVIKTLPRLKQKFKNADLYFIAGSDMLEHMPSWPYIDQMLNQMSLVIGLRNQTTQATVQDSINKLTTKPKSQLIIESPKPNLASGKVRSGQRGSEVLPTQVNDYIKANWLYVAPSKSNSSS